MPSLLNTFLGLLFPDRCGGCGRIGALFCERCRLVLLPYPEPIAQPPPGLFAAHVVYVFDGPLRQAMHQLKYRRVRRMAQPLAALLAGYLAAHPIEVDAVLAVPLHAARLAQRGFNQSALLAQAIASALRLNILDNGLVRERATEQQVQLHTAARIANVQGAFVWRDSLAPPRRLLLIDDVLTTGATMSACAQALVAAGAQEVYGLALARSLPDRN